MNYQSKWQTAPIEVDEDRLREALSDYAHLERKVKIKNLKTLFLDGMELDRFVAVHQYGSGLKELLDMDFSTARIETLLQRRKEKEPELKLSDT